MSYQPEVRNAERKFDRLVTPGIVSVRVRTYDPRRTKGRFEYLIVSRDKYIGDEDYVFNGMLGIMTKAKDLDSQERYADYVFKVLATEDEIDADTYGDLVNGDLEIGDKVLIGVEHQRDSLNFLISHNEHGNVILFTTKKPANETQGFEQWYEKSFNAYPEESSTKRELHKQLCRSIWTDGVKWAKENLI